MSEVIDVICRPAGWILKPRITWVAEAPAHNDPRLAVFHPKSHWSCRATNDSFGGRGASPTTARANCAGHGGC